MCKLRSWPAQSNYTSSIVCMVLYYMFLIVNGVDEFDFLIQLTTSCCLFTNTTCKSKSVFNVKEYGAIGDGITDDTQAFQEAWRMACSEPLNPMIVVPANQTYLVRQTDFIGPCQSTISFTICGSIVAPQDPQVWNGTNMNKWLYFEDVENLTVEGGDPGGMINGMGQQWWARSCKINPLNPCLGAPTAIAFHGCNNLTVRNIQIVDSQQIHMVLNVCAKVALYHLNISAPGDSPNTDGIHISESTNVKIMTADISTGDDCISIVSNSTKVRITNVSCGPGHGISVGSLGDANSYDKVEDVIVNNVRLSNTTNGVRIKTWQGGTGYARNITFQDISMNNVANPIIIDQYYCDTSGVCPNQTLAVNVQNISFVDIKGTSATEEAIRFACSDTSPCKDIHLNNVQLIPVSGNISKCFSWKAYGSGLGMIYPPPCFNVNNNTGNITSSL